MVRLRTSSSGSSGSNDIDSNNTSTGGPGTGVSGTTLVTSVNTTNNSSSTGTLVMGSSSTSSLSSISTATTTLISSSSLNNSGISSLNGSGINNNISNSNTSNNSHHYNHGLTPISQSNSHSSGSLNGGNSSSGMQLSRVLPADHIMFKLMGDFKDHTKVKIDIFIRDDKIKIEDFFDGPESKTFHQVLEGLTEVSKYFLNLIASALLQWRSSQHVIPSKSLSKPKLDDSLNRKDMTPIVDERYKLVVDYIFCISLLNILNSLTKDNLNDQIGSQIESICFDNFKLERRLTSPTIIPDLCASILGQLSKYRLRSISSRFFKEFQTFLSTGNKNKTYPILQGIRFLKVKISSTSKLKQSLEFLTSYLEFFKNARIKGDLRRAISEILASILRPLTEETFKPVLSYTEWIHTIKDLYDIISKKTKKTKDILTSFPLLSILLCCLDKESFLKQFWSLMDNFIKCKDKTIRPYALESCQYLLECYLTKYSELPEEVYERLHQLVSHLFPSGHAKKLTLSASDPLDVFVDIVCVIASSRIDFAFEKIIFDLLRGGDPKDLYISNPERMIVGLRAVMLIDQAGTNPLTPKMLSFSNTPSGQSPSTSPLPDATVSSSSKVRAVRRQRYGTLNMKKVAPTSLIEPYLKNLSIFLSQILIALDGTFGMLLTSNQTKPLPELLEKMRPPGHSCLELLKIAISVIPIAFPSRIYPQDLVVMLSKYLIHLDKGVNEKASIVLTQLMASRPDIRPQIIYGLGKFALYLSDKQSHLISIVLEKQKELLDLWAKSKSDKFSLMQESSDELKFKSDGDNPPDISYVEAVAMVFLCSSNGRNRKICLSILDSIRTVHEAFLNSKQDDEIEITTNLKDIIDENGNEYLYRHAQNILGGGVGGNASSLQSNSLGGGSSSTSATNANGAPPSVGSSVVAGAVEGNRYKRQKSPQDFERVLESESKEDQSLWSACLADIAKIACELCPRTIVKATDLVLARIKPIQPDESQKAQSITAEQEALWIWWRNYIILACITIQIPDNTAIDVKRHKPQGSDNQESPPVSARELFNLILPYLKSMDKFFAESALMALEKTNSGVLEVLFDVLKPFEHELQNKKTKKKTDVIKSVIGIRRHCLESLKPGELVKREMLKKSYIEFAQEVLQFLNVVNSDSSNSEYLWDSLHYIRFNFCAMVHRIVQQLYAGGHEFLEKNLRREFFRAFSKWSESEELLHEESTIRKFGTYLQQEEKESVKRKEIEHRVHEHASQLSNVASHAVSVILLGPHFIETFKDPNGVIFQWINNMFLSITKIKIRSVTRLGLQNFLKHNLTHQELIYHCVNQCYSVNSALASGYFISLVELCQDQMLKFDSSESIMMNLVIFNTGNKLSSVRQHSLQLLSLIRASKVSSNELYFDSYYPSAIGSEIPETYLFSQYHLSEKLSLENPDLCYEFFMDIVYRLESVSQEHQRQMLNYVKPWIKQMSLDTLAAKHGAVLLEAVLEGLVLISIQYSVHHSHLIEEIWRILGNNQNNIAVIIDYILSITERTRNHDLIPIFKKICIFMGRSSPQRLVDSLVSELTSTSAQSFTTDYSDPKTLGKVGGGKPLLRVSAPNTSTSVAEVHYNTVLAISLAFQNATENFERTLKSYPLTRFQLPLIFLSEVSFEVGEEFRTHLSILLQLIFLGLYYNHQPVHEHCRMFLLNLIRSLVIKKFQIQDGAGTLDNPAYEDAVQLVDFLLPSVYRTDEGTTNALSREIQTKKDISNPKYVVMLSKRVVSVLCNGSNDLKEMWGVSALNWATNSPNQKLAMRSFQILRGLEPTTTIDSLTEVMQTLGKYTQNVTPENALVISEIQETLSIMIRCIHPSKLILFPQIFWGTLALLNTDFENHFIGSVKLLIQLLEVVNFSDRAVQNVFLASMPKDWDNFQGVQPLAIKGLLGTNTAQITVEFLSKITLQPCDEIFHPESSTRFITNLVSLLPYLCVNIGDNQSALPEQISENLSILCENHGYTRLSTIFLNYSQHVYHKQLDTFLQDLTPPLCESVIKHSTLIFSLLFNIIEFGPVDYRYPILKILTALVKGGVNPAETKSSRVPEWFDTMIQFLNDHKTPHHIVSQATRLIEISAGNSPTSLLTIDNASMKPSKSIIGKKFTNKPERGTLIAANSLAKVLETCAKSTLSLTKSMYSTTQIFEAFFSANDEHIHPSGFQKAYESGTDEYSDHGGDSSSVISNGLQPTGSDIELDTDTLNSNDFNNDGGGGAEFHNFPHFQGFNDILEGLGDMSMNDDSSFLDSSTSTTATNSSIILNSTTLNIQSGGKSGMTPSSSNSNIKDMKDVVPPSPIPTVHHLINSSQSNSSSNLLNFSSASNSSNEPSTTKSTTSNNNNSNIQNPPSSPLISNSNRNNKNLTTSTSPTLSRNMQFHTNSTLSTLSYNVTAAKSWWNSCSEQIEFTSEKDLFEAFSAASQLTQQITIEYKTLFHQCLPLVQSIASEVSALSVDVFEKSLFTTAHSKIQNINQLSEKYAKLIGSNVTQKQQFLDKRELVISNYTNLLKLYTEQRTSTNNTRAKLFENGISNDESQIQITETRFSFAICNLYQHLLQLWIAFISMQELLVDFSAEPIHPDKQRDEVKKELNKCKVLAVLFKEKESELLSKNLQQQLQHHNNNSSNNNNNSSPTQHHLHLHQQHFSPTLSSPPINSQTPIASSPVSLSSPSLLDDSQRITVTNERKRSSTSTTRYN